MDPELRLQDAGRARKDHVRRRGGDDDQADVRRRQSGRFDRPARRVQREIARLLFRRRDVPLREFRCA